MSLLTGISDFFGLDIGTTAVRAVQLRNTPKEKALLRYGSQPINARVSQSDSATDQKQLLDTIVSLTGQTGINTRNVAVGAPSKDTFITVVDMPKLSQQELIKTIRYQAENYIPTPLDEVKLDWAILGDSPQGPDKVEVLLASTPKGLVEERMDLLESIGFNVIAIEPDALALARSLTPRDTTNTQMLLDIGNQATDLIISLAGAPRLVRASPTGGQSFVKSAMQNLAVDEKQASQFVFKFGLGEDKLEGQVYKAIQSTVDSLISEVEKSVKFFTTRYQNIPIEKIIVTGGASTLPEFPLYLANRMNIPVEIGNSWLNVSYPQKVYNELMSISNQFGVAVGLAERNE